MGIPSTVLQMKNTLLAVALGAALCAGAALAEGPESPESTLLAPLQGPYGGVPPFDKVKPALFKPALLQAMELQRKEIAAITSSEAAPSFANTIAALEDSGRGLRRAESLLGTFSGTMNDREMQAVEQETAPILAAFQDEIVQNGALFARIRAVHEGRAAAPLTAEQLRLTEVVYRNFARSGAALGAPEKARLKEINGKLAQLYTSFSQHQLADEERESVVLESEADLAGLPETARAAMKSDAEAKGLSGKWLVANTRSSAEPFLVFSSRRELREKVWRMWVSRGERSGPSDNRPVITEILALRAERAKLLGYPTHAHWIIADRMAKTPDAAMDLMQKVWRATAARVREEVADMQKVADAEGGAKIEAWDYRYYAEKVRKAKYDLDQNEVKPYLQLDKMREGMFWVAEQLYGLSFRPLSGVPVYHPDVTVYEVMRGGARAGLWYFDPYARAGKRSGAWMSEYRTQERFKDETTPIVSNNSNFVKGKAGEPVLISWDDANTLFHEFGHALHGLLSSVQYPSLAGTSTLRDFVEFPSQLNEHWLMTSEVLNRFALHYQTGQPIPPQLVAKIRKARDFNQGFRTGEYLLSAIYDLKIHTEPATAPIDPVAFEKRTLAELGAPSELALRHRPTHFGHIFGGDGYSAGYYSYLWADTLTADAGEAFVEAGGYYDKATAKRLDESILRIGNSVSPEEAFRRFRGRDVDTDALMRSRGFPLP
jgi:peptidyl-dipeptidase Dcp